jgi:regulator of sigma E protease
MLAGIGFNIILGYILCSILFFAGMPPSVVLYPNNATPVIEKINPKSAAEKAGFIKGDRILAADGKALTDQEMPEFILNLRKSPNKTIALTVDRLVDGQHQEQQLPLTIASIASRECPEQQQGSTGIIFARHSLEPLSLLDSIKAGFDLTNGLIVGTVTSLKRLCTRGDTKDLGGPVMLVSQTAGGAQEGFKSYLLFLAYISVAIGIMNILPLPIFDGGQVLFFTIQSIIGRPIPNRVREIIHITCWVAVLALMLYLTYTDIEKLISPYWERIVGFFCSK